ncbi:MAG: hypothetical protein E7396_08535 [Ruminococcaceae bacterium]|nr:hypothetical protein [Oscillospiraceae bacterium]
MYMKLLGKIKTYSSKEIKNSFVSVGFECVDRDLINPQECYDALRDSGIKYARCQTGWAKCEKEKGVYDFTWLDDMVDNLCDMGIEPWFNVGFGNPLYMKEVPNPTAVGCVPTLYGEEATEAWISFVKEVAKRYIGKVRDYEIWNEPNLLHFWYPGKPSGEEYARLIKITGKAIREVNPHARIGGCTCSDNITEYFTFADDMTKNLTESDIDFFSLHLYTKHPDEENSYQRIKYIKTIFLKNGLTNVVFRQGEAGYPNCFPVPLEKHTLIPKSGQTSHRQCATWMLRRYFIDKSLDMEISSYFILADPIEKPYQKVSEIMNDPPRYGLLEGKTYKINPAYYVLKRISTVLEDTVPSELYISLRTNIDELKFTQKILHTYTKNGSPIYAYYIPTYVADEKDFDYKLTLEISNYETDKPIKNPVYIDMMNGDVFEIDEIDNVRDHISKFKNLPIKDYPVVVCDKSLIDIE